MNRFALTVVAVFATWPASAQTPQPNSMLPPRAAAAPQVDTTLGTRPGHEVTFTIGGYNYVEPGDLRISIHGPKFGGAYTGAFPLVGRRWFALANVRGTAGAARYDGWCLPWLIRPSQTSPNGYALGLGGASTCSETGDFDGYLDARALVSRDITLRKWGLSPQVGAGLRYLSNATTGVANFRTDRYLYLPLGLAARTHAGPSRTLALNGEYDVLLRGHQTTRESKLGGGGIPGTATTPPFTIDRFTDLSFPQGHGWALRASATYQVTRRWSIGPSYVHWHVGDSPVRFTTVTFTVNNIAAQQQLGAFEPVNTTDEWSVNLGFHF